MNNTLRSAYRNSLRHTRNGVSDVLKSLGVCRASRFTTEFSGGGERLALDRVHMWEVS